MAAVPQSREAQRREAGTPIADLPVPHPNVESALDVERALASLDSRERAAALLCFSEGYSHGEAAAILDLPLGTLKSLAARARTRLTAYLEGAGS